MSRNLKFRVYSKAHKRFVTANDFDNGCGINLSGGFSICDQNYFGGRESDEDYIIQQYTDKWDKNGKLVCEGDIVEYKMYYQEIPGDLARIHRCIGKVIWQNSAFELYGEIRGFFNLSRELTIIGNIFENSQLLK